MSTRNAHLKLFRGQPIPLIWHGWHSDTHSLDRQGWEINASESYYAEYDCHKVTLAALTPARDLIIAATMVLDYRDICNARLVGHEIFSRPLIMNSYQPHFEYKYVQYREAPEIDFHAFESMSPIDVFSPSSFTEIRRLKDLKIFQKKPEPQTKEIYIPSNSVDECLDRILQIQHPQQQDLKKRLLLPETKPIIQAKIFSLAA